MKSASELTLHINAPVTHSMAAAQKLDSQTCQLVIALGESQEARTQLASLLGTLLANGPAALLVIGPFEGATVTSERLGTDPVATIQGMNVYQIDDPAAVAKGILEIDAEEVAMFACPRIEIDEHIARMESNEGRRWTGSKSIRAALTGAPDQIDPAFFYSSSHDSIEVLGTRAAIRRSAAVAWKLI